MTLLRQASKTVTVYEYEIAENGGEQLTYWAVQVTGGEEVRGVIEENLGEVIARELLRINRRK